MGIGRKILGKLTNLGSSSDTGETLKQIWNALDPGKWGSPLTKGEAHYINDIVVEKFYKERDPEDEQRKVLALAEIYDDLVDDFAGFRHGWLAEYMGDAFADNAFTRLLFLIATRTGQVGRVIVESIETTERTPGVPTGAEDKMWAVIWATFFFHFLSLVYAEVTGFSSLMELWIIWPTLLGVYVCYVKWYGRYGMYLPALGTQSVPSALATVVLLATTVRVGVEVIPFVSMDWIPLFFEPTQIPIIGRLVHAVIVIYAAVAAVRVVTGFIPAVLVTIIFTAPVSIPVITGAFWWVITAAQTLQVPHPFFVGLGPLVANMEWGLLLTTWGLAGLANVYYGEWIYNLSDQAKEIHAMKRIMDEEISHMHAEGHS